MTHRGSFALLVGLGLCACGGSGGGGGGGAAGVNLTNFQVASAIIGQSTANGALANNGAGATNQVGLLLPQGHVGSGSLYVPDSFNNRVLGWNAIPAGLGQPADFVVGQALFTSQALGTSATGLAAPRSCWAADNALFIADTGNSRIVLHAPPPTSNSAASVALGKPDLVTNGSTNGQDGLDQPFDVCVAANRVVVADTFNNRVMIWHGVPVASGAAAQVVVGQPDFLTFDAGTATNKMAFPTGVWTDGTRLVVADNGNHRVLVWLTFPTASGQAPDLVVGQPDFTSNTSGAGAQKLNNPGSVASDGIRLFVADSDNCRVLIFHPFPTASNPAATGVLGQANFTNIAPNDDDQDGTTDGATARTLFSPSGVTVVGNQLFVTDGENDRVLVFTGS